MLSILMSLEHVPINTKSLPHTPSLGSSNSAANKDMMSKIWTNGDTIYHIEKKTLWGK